jgi:hypothetical protein
MAALLAAAAAGGEGPAPAQETAGDERDRKKLERLAEPWPDASKLAERQAEARDLPLFQSDEPLELSLAADFDALKDDREVDSTARFPGVLSLSGEDGVPITIGVEVGTRGNLRLNPRVCSFPPLKVELSKKQSRGTPFEGQGSLKLVTHCHGGGDYEERVLEEALAYRVANVVTPASFRIRLARIRYVDDRDGDEIDTRWAFFIEDVDDVARRLLARVAPLEGKLFHQVDRPSLLRLSVFQFAIGNTDYSIYGLHNVRLVQDRHGTLTPVPYDFDVTGLVNAPYGRPGHKLRISSLRDRLYRGPCAPLEELEPILSEFRALRAEVLALYDTGVVLDRKRRRSTKKFLTGFFDIIDSPHETRKYFVERCKAVAGV